MAQLPPFDEPASPEVTAYRIASIRARTSRCARTSGGATRAEFLRANADVHALAGTVRGAVLVSQLAVPHRDGNGCPEGSGPATSFTTDREYRLPTSYEVAAGETCERAVGVHVPSIILPPPPGIRADLRGDTIVVEWSFERILGDCPPWRIVLSVEKASREVARTTRIDVHERSGTAELRLPGSSRTASVLRAETESADGTRSRPAAVLIRRQT